MTGLNPIRIFYRNLIKCEQNAQITDEEIKYIHLNLSCN